MASGQRDQAFTDTTRFRVMRTVIGASNPFVKALLGSRFAGPLGRNVALLRFRGRKSGAWRSTPVGYVRDGDRVIVVTSPTYRWWRNVVDGAPVQIRVSGQWHEASARVLFPDDPAYDEAIRVQVGGRGTRLLRGFGIPVTDSGEVPADARADAPKRAHIVRIDLGQAISRPS